eukprot:scaffold21809_cov24-Cyclotella_meneghiniana.AAC.1
MPKLGNVIVKRAASGITVNCPNADGQSGRGPVPWQPEWTEPRSSSTIKQHGQSKHSVKQTVRQNKARQTLLPLRHNKTQPTIHQERSGTNTHNNTTRRDPPPLPLPITYQMLLSKP